MKRNPEYFLLGAPKCGTTALANYLEKHPLVQVSQPKGPNYFCKDLKAVGLPISSDAQYLDTFFPDLENSHVTAALDTSIWYLYSHMAVNEILRFNPEARFFVMLRNPVDMVWSWHSQLTFQGQENEKNFMAAWKLQEERSQNRKIPPGLWLDTKMLLYKDVCSLGSQLQRVFELVPREKVHIELSFDLKQYPKDTYQRILNFMGVPYDGRTKFDLVNTGRKIRSPLIFNILRSKVSLKTVYFIKGITGIKTFGVGRPDLNMPLEVRKFLVEEFKSEIDLIEHILDRNLSHWRKV